MDFLYSSLQVFDLWPVYLVILNLLPDIRINAHNVVSGALLWDEQATDTSSIGASHEEIKTPSVAWSYHRKSTWPNNLLC